MSLRYATASRLVSTYLDIQKLEDGHTLTISPRKVSLKKLLQSEINLIMAPIDERRKATFDFQVQVPDDVEIMGDPSRLSQIFGNLIENAVKYSPQGGTVNLRWSQNERYDKVTIADQGLGMSEEGQKKLFARFVRLEQDHSIRGTGLGLFIVRRLVESHGGKIEVESQEGEGTIFHVFLPSGQE